MNYNLFKDIILEHRNSLIIIGVIFLIIIIVTALVIEIYVRGELKFEYFQFKKIKFSPTLLLIIPLIFGIIYFSFDIANCNKDIQDNSYETYIGECEYTSTSVKLKDLNLSIYVGKGHEIVPRGINYGKCIYAKHSKVIVFFESLPIE